ncbi:MAG: glycosyltransferase [Candidatus Saccharibacteria bacterium]|nr:glycosyltransferase [Candidatus Saccharibacteria bacterium]
MIPKRIHYCWFGGKDKPKSVQKCIRSWKKFCPDYEIIEWNEQNYDVNKNKYTKGTYGAGKFAFLSDYVRLDVIYNEGGIYLDTDVELIKGLDDLLDCTGYIGLEDPGLVNTGQGFGAVKKHSFIKKNKEYYEKKNFFKNGKFQKELCTRISSDLLKKEGMTAEDKVQEVAGMRILPTDYFCPLKVGTSELKMTENTYSIHHFDSTWKGGNKISRWIGYRLIPLKKTIKTAISMLKNKQGRSQLAVYIYFAIISFFKGIGATGDNKIYLVFYGVGCLLLCYKVLHDRYRLKEALFCLIPLVASLITLITGEATTALFLTISICCLKDVDKKVVIKIFFWTKVFAYVLVLLLMGMGIIENVAEVYERQSMGEQIRYTVGFGHPNIAHVNLAIIAFLYYYCYHRNRKILDLLIIFISNFLLYQATFSRTSFWTINLFIVTVFMIERIKWTQKVMSFVASKIYVMLVIGSIVLPLMWPHFEFTKVLNAHMTGRLFYENTLLRYRKIQWFGKKAYTIRRRISPTEVKRVDIMIDNSYFYLGYCCGFLYFLWYSYMMISVSQRYYRNGRKDKELLMILFMCFMAFFENILANAAMGFCTLWFADRIFDDEWKAEGRRLKREKQARKLEKKEKKALKAGKTVKHEVNDTKVDLTIFTPTYNRAKLLERLYESLCEQINKGFTWLVIDDGSTDETGKLVKKWQKEKKIKIKYIKQENQGKYIAHNRAMKETETNYFVCIDSDDYLIDVNSVELIVEGLRRVRKDQVGAVFPYKKAIDVVEYSFETDIQEMKLNAGHVVETTIAGKTEVFRKCLFPENKKETFMSEDVVYNQVAQYGKFRFFNNAVVTGEYLDDGMTSHVYELWCENYENSMTYFDSRYKYLKKYKLADRVEERAKCVIQNNAVNIKCGKKVMERTPSKFLSVIYYIPSVIYSRRVMK